MMCSPMDNRKACDFVFRELTFENVDRALELCEKCVGENLYTKTDLITAITSPDRFYYLVFDGDNIAGYIYFLLTDIEKIESDVKYHHGRLSALCQDDNAIVGRIQSVGVDENYRGRGLSSQMIEFSLGILSRQDVDICFVVCWKIDDHVPLEPSVRTSGFVFFDLAYRIWYDNEKLFCEYCCGRCKCDAAVYYKLLKKER